MVLNGPSKPRRYDVTLAGLNMERHHHAPPEQMPYKRRPAQLLPSQFQMTYSVESSHQRYSSELAAYTLKQFSAARTALDNHKAAAAKLPASHSYDYRVPRSTSSDSNSPSPQSPAIQSPASTLPAEFTFHFRQILYPPSIPYPV
ncbi:hypothetical protein LshimejAT787_0408700 [Lyophyllum shimeji]|uniref:Uncharacterized protein n=1 Tax=Lyophyllum shimeji TaxID=47721 RepID=A0A9P3PLT8_LYOSH|nr:hypothetical protein LshimejAT787_0408700 [Lyophyllum shimeji]